MMEEGRKGRPSLSGRGEKVVEDRIREENCKSVKERVTPGCLLEEMVSKKRTLMNVEKMEHFG